MLNMGDGQAVRTVVGHHFIDHMKSMLVLAIPAGLLITPKPSVTAKLRVTLDACHVTAIVEYAIAKQAIYYQQILHIFEISFFFAYDPWPETLVMSRHATMQSSGTNFYLHHVWEHQD